MNISDVAKKTGLTSKAIRFYEEKGLVTPPLRSENGYRTYSQQHLDELTLLRQARQVGFNLEECRELVALFNDPSRHSADVKNARWRKWRISRTISASCKICARTCWRWPNPAPATTARSARLSIIFPAAAIARRRLNGRRV